MAPKKQIKIRTSLSRRDSLYISQKYSINDYTIDIFWGSFLTRNAPPRASRLPSLFLSALLLCLVNSNSLCFFNLSCENDHYAPHSLSFSHYLRFPPPRIAGSLSFLLTVSSSWSNSLSVWVFRLCVVWLLRNEKWSKLFLMCVMLC